MTCDFRRGLDVPCGAPAGYIVVEVTLAPGKLLRVPGRAWRCANHQGIVPVDSLDAWREEIRGELVRRMPGHEETIRRLPVSAFAFGISKLSETEAKRLEAEWVELGIRVDRGDVRIPVEHVPQKDFQKAIRDYTRN